MSLGLAIDSTPAMRIPAHRLDRQLISRGRFTSPAEVVAWLGAVQAQDYLASLWAIGLRLPKATEATVEAAITDGSVIRTHLFRGTWQLVAREDVRWMLGLVGDRVLAGMARRHRELELDERTLRRSGELFAGALLGGKQLTRREMGEVLTQAGVTAARLRLIHILGHAELSGVVCSGGRLGKQPTYALLDDRVPRSFGKTREEGLAELARRYFQSRGPATIRDFVWWTGLPSRVAREALEFARETLVSRRVEGENYWLIEEAVGSPRAPSAHLLPAFDEYLVGYRDRSAVVDPAHLRKVNSGGGLLAPVVLIDGRVVGTWKRTLGKHAVEIALQPFGALLAREQENVARAAHRYGEFVDLEVLLPRQSARGRKSPGR